MRDYIHDYIPKSHELQQILSELGFTFELHKPSWKHPDLVVKFQGYTLPPGVRFAAMRGILWAMRRIANPGPLRDVCYLSAWDAYKRRNQC